MSESNKKCDNEPQKGKKKLMVIRSCRKFQDLSLEVVVKIFSYINQYEIANLNIECRLFRHAIAINTRDRLNYCRKQINKEVSEMWKNVNRFTSYENRFLENIIQLTFLQSDIQLFYVLVWRYINNLHAWSYLCRFILPIIHEIDNEIKNIKERKEVWLFFEGCRIVHPLLQNFLNDFDENIEFKIINENPEKNYFFIKLVDILTMCPAANYFVVYEENTNDRTITKIDLDVQLRNMPFAGSIINDINVYLDTYSKEVELMKCVQRGIRYANMIYANELLLTYLPGSLCYYMDCNGFVYYSLAGWFRCFTRRNNHEHYSINSSLAIYNYKNNIKKYIFEKNVDYQTYSSGLFFKIIINCSPNLQPITFNEMYENSSQNGINHINIYNNNNNNKNMNILNDIRKTKKTRNNFLNEFDLQIYEDIGAIDKKKVREIRWTFCASLNDYNKSESRHNFYG